MTILETQQLFFSLLPDLINKAIELGFDPTGGELWRPDITAKYYAELEIGIKNSNHTQRCAIDINLYKDGKYLNDSEDYLPLGEFWESLHPLCRWGGRFKKPDGDHFSLELNGVR